MTPVTRKSAAAVHIANQATRYDYLNAAKMNLNLNHDDQQQQQYDQECFEEGNGSDDACISTKRTTRNSKVKQQQQQPTPAASKKNVAFANQKQTQKQQQPAPAQQQQQQQHEQQPAGPKGKVLSKRQAKKYDAQVEQIEAANILASITAAVAAAAAVPKERTPPYWTRQHEKAKAGARLQKAMSSSVFECEFI